MTDPTATAEPSLKRAHDDDDHQSPVPSSSHLEDASSSTNILSSEVDAQKRPRLPITTDDTKSESPSPGANEVTILPGLVLPLNEEVLRTFFQYSHDRHDVFLKRKEGKPQEEWTDDPVFKSTKFANVYRVLDRLTQYVLTRVVQDGPQQLEEVCFRVLLFRSFARISTYEVIRAALGGPPTLANFSPTAYENFLMPHISAGNPVYGSSYFIPAPREFRTKDPYQSTLRLVHLMMRTGLPRRLADLHHMRDAHALLTSFPSLGPFLAMQLLLDLNLSDHFDFSEEEFAACGPGSKQCLVDIFGKYVSGFELEAMRWIQKEQEHYWAKYGITDVPHLCPARKPGLNVVDIEHTLCEVFKYRRARGRMEAPPRNVRGSKRGRRGRGAARATPVAAYPARGIKQEDEDGLDGLDFERIRSNGSKTSGQEKVKSFVPTGDAVTGHLPAKWLVPRAPEEYERPPPVDRSEDVYEVSHIVAMTPTQSKCLVRWKGFGPDDDTWEYFDELVNGGAKEAVEEYLKWLRTVKDEIEAMLDEEKSNREALEKMPAASLMSSATKASPEPHGFGTRPALPFANMPLALPF